MDDAEDILGGLEEKFLGVQNGFLETQGASAGLSASSPSVGAFPAAPGRNAARPRSGRVGEAWRLLCRGDTERFAPPCLRLQRAFLN